MNGRTAKSWSETKLLTYLSCVSRNRDGEVEVDVYDDVNLKMTMMAMERRIVVVTVSLWNASMDELDYKATHVLMSVARTKLTTVCTDNHSEPRQLLFRAKEHVGHPSKIHGIMTTINPINAIINVTKQQFMNLRSNFRSTPLLLRISLSFRMRNYVHQEEHPAKVHKTLTTGASSDSFRKMEARVQFRKHFFFNMSAGMTANGKRHGDMETFLSLGK